MFTWFLSNIGLILESYWSYVGLVLVWCWADVDLMFALSVKYNYVRAVFVLEIGKEIQLLLQPVQDSSSWVPIRLEFDNNSRKELNIEWKINSHYWKLWSINVSSFQVIQYNGFKYENWVSQTSKKVYRPVSWRCKILLQPNKPISWQKGDTNTNRAWGSSDLLNPLAYPL